MNAKSCKCLFPNIFKQHSVTNTVCAPACVCVCVSFPCARRLPCTGPGAGGEWGAQWASGDRFLRLISFLSQALTPLLRQLKAEYIKEFVTVSFSVYVSNESACNRYQIFETFLICCNFSNENHPSYLGKQKRRLWGTVKPDKGLGNVYKITS